MYKYNKYGLKLESDFEIRTVYEDDKDIDLFLQLNNRPINMEIKDLPSFLPDRFQINNIGNILLRLSKKETNTLTTIHFLRNIDLNSSFLNFTLDYREKSIFLREGEFSLELRIE